MIKVRTGGDMINWSKVKVVNDSGSTIDWEQDGSSIGSYNGYTWLEISGGSTTNGDNYDDLIAMIANGDHLQVWTKATL